MNETQFLVKIIGDYLNSPMVMDVLERHKFNIEVRTIDKPTDCPQLRVDWHNGDETKTLAISVNECVF
jgi:hypothetical protein